MRQHHLPSNSLLHGLPCRPGTSYGQARPCLGASRGGASSRVAGGWQAGGAWPAGRGGSLSEVGPRPGIVAAETRPRAEEIESRAIRACELARRRLELAFPDA